MNAILANIMGLLKDYFINYPDRIYIYLKHLYIQYDGGWFIFFISLCLFFYFLVYFITHIGTKQYKTRDVLKNIAEETKSQYTETKHGEIIAGCHYMDRIFKIDNSKPRVNPYIEISCPYSSNLTMEIIKKRETEEVIFKINSVRTELADKIMAEPGIRALYDEFMGPAGEMYMENGEIVVPMPFKVFADEDESFFIDERKVYENLGKLAKFTQLIESKRV